MNFIKRLIPNNIKQEGKYFLYRLLKEPYNRFQIPLPIIKWLPATAPITFIDIGASVGHFSSAISQHYEIKKAILIEPLTKWKQLLESTFPNRDRFTILNIAVAQNNGTANLFVIDELDSTSSLLEIKREAKELEALDVPLAVPTLVTIETLDHVVKESGCDMVDLIKIDVQGAEHLVIQGGAEVLKKTRFVFTEFSYKPLYDNSSTFFDLYQLMTELDFRLVDILPGFHAPNGELLQGDALFVNNRFE